MKNWVILQLGVLKQSIHRIQPESRYAAFVPPAFNSEHGVLHRGISPVQIRLFRIEVMVVVLICRWIELPRRSSKGRYPVVGRLPGPFSVAPDIPVAMRRRARRFRIQKPLVLIGGMIDHKIKDDTDVALFCLTGQYIKIRQSTVHGIDVLVIGNVVAKIHLRRGETRGNPDRIHSQVLQVVQLRSDSFQVSNAVIIAVSEAARINLVEDCVLPPLMAFFVHGTVRRLSKSRHP